MKEAMNYTAADIEHYHNGVLLPAERHAMEKAALDDPFLADALEGFAFTKTPAADLSALQQKLQQRVKKDNKKSLFFITSTWMKIAALFIVIAGGGWLIFHTGNSSSSPDVAKNSPQEKQINTSPQFRSSAADTVPAYLSADSINETVALNKSDKTITDRSRSFSKDEVSSQKQSSPQPLPGRENVNSPVVMQAPSYQQNNSLKERADSMPNTTALSRATTEGYQRKTDTISNFNVVLKNIEVPLDEVVVVNKKQNTINPRSQYMKMTVDTLEPENGWHYYDDYIANNLRSPDELKIKPVNGSVELSFEVNKDGEPVNVTVTKSLCDKCDEEAVRLLKQGPRWKKKAKKGKLKIKF